MESSSGMESSMGYKISSSEEGGCCHSRIVVKWIHTKFDNLIDMNHFYVCVGQKREQISVCYLVYRWIMTLLTFSSFVITLGDFGNPLRKYARDYSFYAKYFIYMTNITLTLSVVQQFLGAIILSVGAKRHGFKKRLPPPTEVVGIRYHYWKLWELSMMTSITISFIYWLVVYPNAVSGADMNAHIGHSFNAVYAITDWWASGLPYNLSDLWIGWTHIMVFFAFVYIYWVANGWPRPSPTERDVSTRVLYPGCSDFRKPSQVLQCFTVYLGVISLVHIIFCAMFLIKRRFLPKQLDEFATSNISIPAMGQK